MTKYDAFGREIGEDTLGGLGRKPEPAEAEPVTAPPEPESAHEAAVRQEMLQRLGGAMSGVATARAAAAPSVVAKRRSRAGVGCLISLVLLLAIAGGGVALVLLSVGSAVRSGGTLTVKRPSLPRARPAPKGLATGSLVRPAAFEAALRSLRAAELGRLTSLRVAPERIDAQLLTSGGRLRSVQLRPGEKLDTLGPASGPGFDTTPTIPFARLDPTAPARLARRGAAKLRQRTTDLQYLVPTRSGATVTWGAYFLRGRYVLGDAAGRYERSYP